MSTTESIKTFFSVMMEYAPKFLPGVYLTLLLAFFSILLGTILGLIMALFRLSKFKPFQIINKIYISIIRGTPLLLQLYFIFFGLPLLGFEFNRFTSAIVGLALHNGAYISEIFRGAIESIDSGQREAAKAIGMTKMQSMRRIIFPQALKRALPSLGNQFIIAVKDSSLASVITITETMLLARQYASAAYNVFPIYTLAGIYYWIIIMVLTKALTMVEAKFKINERR